jgi:hypothetical protein
VVTQVRNSAAISRFGPTEHREIITIDSERVARPQYRLSDRLRGGAGKGWTTIAAFSSLSYYFFEFEMWRQLGNRIRNREFDIVHRVTPLSPTSQSLIARSLARHNIPFILGPLNGGIPWPKHFNVMPNGNGCHTSEIFYKLMPGYRTTRRHSSAIIAGSKYVYNDLPSWARAKTVHIPENGVDLEKFSIPRTRWASIPLKAAFVGRLATSSACERRSNASFATLTVWISLVRPEGRRVEEKLTWDAKSRQILAVYDCVMAQHPVGAVDGGDLEIGGLADAEVQLNFSDARAAATSSTPCLGYRFAVDQTLFKF